MLVSPKPGKQATIASSCETMRRFTLPIPKFAPWPNSISPMLEAHSEGGIADRLGKWASSILRKNGGHMSAWSIAWVGFLVALFGGSAIIDFRRGRHLAAWATARRFVPLGKLPKTLSLEGTGLSNTTSVWNAYEGDSHGIRIVFFDCRLGTGKRSRRRTVIAAEAPRDVFENILSDRSTVVDKSEQWQILYGSRAGSSFSLSTLMPVEELEARVDAILP